MRYMSALALAVVLACGGCETMKMSPIESGGMSQSAAPAKPAEQYPLDAKGYIKNWLVLAPINYGASNYVADDIDKAQIPNEATMTPKEGDKVKVKSEEAVGGAAPAMVDKELTWKKVATADYFIDFNELTGHGGEGSVGGYAVAYLNAPEEIKGVTFSLSTNDNGVIYLNGKNVFKVVIGRALAEDSDTVTDVTLNKGVNTLIFKVWNDSNDWQGCIRLLDKAGQPLKNVTVQLQK